MVIREKVGGLVPAVLFWNKPKEENWAITLYPFIFYRFFPTFSMRCHEFIHVKQIQEEGFFKFYIKWAFWTFRYGYQNNPFELEAYGFQSDPDVHELLSKQFPQLTKGVQA